MEHTDYIPVGCDIDDRLEDAMVRRKSISLVYKQGDAEGRTETKILSVKTVGREEFALLEGISEQIRLDRILEMDGVDFRIANYC